MKKLFRAFQRRMAEGRIKDFKETIDILDREIAHLSAQKEKIRRDLAREEWALKGLQKKIASEFPSR